MMSLLRHVMYTPSKVILHLILFFTQYNKLILFVWYNYTRIMKFDVTSEFLARGRDK